jgi:Ca-activated chloride channel homolog
MSRATRFYGIACLVTGVLAAGIAGGEPPAQMAASAEKPTDFTPDANEMNSNKFAGPPKEFRQGHVTPRKLEESALSTSKKGYRIQLPSKAPIPTPTVYRGKLYASGGFHSKEFYCLDAATGKLIWGRDLDDDGPTSAVCDDGVVVFNTESCTIFALNADTGEMLWSYWLGDPLTSTPAIADGKVFTSYPCSGGNAGAENQANGPANHPFQQSAPAAQGSQAAAKPPKPGADKTAPPNASHVLACMELKTGKILWQRWLDSDVMTAPTATDGELYVTTFSGTVYKFKQADGSIVSAQKSRATSAPVVVGKSVYLTKRVDAPQEKVTKESVAAVSRDSAQPQFNGSAKEAKYLDLRVQTTSNLKGKASHLDEANGFGGGIAPATANAGAASSNIGQDNVSTLQAFQGSRLLHMDGRNFNCMGDELICTSAETGKTAWSVKLKGDLEKEGGFLGSPPASAGGQLFVATLKGEVLRIAPENGKISETYAIGAPIRSQPAIDRGRLYVGTDDGQIVCVDTGNAAFTNWSTWGGNAAHTGVAKK